MTSMSISSRFLGDSFTAVGKPAPPRPTRPLARMASVKDLKSVTWGGAMEGSTFCSPSGVMTTVVWVDPLDPTMVVISATVPDTPEWMSAETKPPALPTTVPTYTWSPLATAGAAGAPMCCPMDRTILDGRGIATVSRLEVPFSWGTPAPCAERLRKLLIQISTSLYCILGITFVLFFVWRVGTPFLPGLSSRLLSLPKSIK